MPDFTDSLIAGTTAGVVSRFVIAPLDVLKIRFQIQSIHKPLPASPSPLSSPNLSAPLAHSHPSLPPSPPKFTSLLQATRTIWREEGVRAFWKGTVPSQLMIAPYSAVSFGTYTFFKNMLTTPDTPPSASTVLICGSLSGIFATTATYPLDLIRTRLTAQRQSKIYPTFRAACVTIVKQEGIQGLYQGMAPTLLGIIPYMAIQFTVYEQLSATFSRYSKAFSGGNAAASDNDPYNSNGSADVYNGRTEGRNDVVATASTCKDDDERRKRKTGRGCSSSTKASDTETNTRSTNTTIATNAGDVHNTSPQAELLAAGKFVSGFCAGIIGKACTMPFDVVKKRLQVQHFDYERSAAGTSGGMHQPSADKGGRHCSSSVTNRDSGSVKGKSTSNIENNDNNGNGDRSRNHNKQTPNDRHTTMSKSRAITHHQSTGPSARAPAAATTSTSESSSLNFLRYTRTLVKQEGIMSLYRGMVPTILKAGPNSAILFFVHDQVSTLLKRRRNSHTLHAHDDL